MGAMDESGRRVRGAWQACISRMNERWPELHLSLGDPNTGLWARQ